jgi:hypothetical protein
MSDPMACGAVWMDDIQLAFLCHFPATTPVVLRGRRITVCKQCAVMHNSLDNEGTYKGLRLVGKHYQARTTDPTCTYWPATTYTLNKESK